MPVDIALHPLGTAVHGNHPSDQVVPVLAQQAGLAEDTQSATLVVPKPGGKLVLVATVKLRVDVRALADAGSLSAATSGMVLGANERVALSLPAGSFVLKTLTYA